MGVEEHPLKVEAAQGAYDTFASTKHPHFFVFCFRGQVALWHGSTGSYGASSMSAAVGPCVVRGLDIDIYARSLTLWCMKAAWLPYFDDGERRSIST